MLKNVVILLISLLLTTGCTLFRKPKPEPAPVPETPVIVAEEAQPAEEPALVVAEPDELASEAVEQEAEEIIEPGTGAQTAIDPKLDLDQILSDSIWVDYMIKPGDYLSLIAYNEYGNANEWRRIYSWNKEKIGDDPDIIYPYNELDLKKPRGKAVEFDYDFTVYQVKSGESLWSIAKKVYGDEYAWVVLFWDNEKMLNDEGGKLLPGMELKVRSALWPEYEE